MYSDDKRKSGNAIGLTRPRSSTNMLKTGKHGAKSTQKYAKNGEGFGLFLPSNMLIFWETLIRASQGLPVP